MLDEKSPVTFSVIQRRACAGDSGGDFSWPSEATLRSAVAVAAWGDLDLLFSAFSVLVSLPLLFRWGRAGRRRFQRALNLWVTRHYSWSARDHRRRALGRRALWPALPLISYLYRSSFVHMGGGVSWIVLRFQPWIFFLRLARCEYIKTRRTDGSIAKSNSI